MNPKVDTYLDGIGKWQEEMGKLRKVILDFGLHDANGILAKPGERTQAGRLIRFTQMQEIYEMEPILKDEFKKTSEYETPGNFSPGWMKCRHLKLHLKP